MRDISAAAVTETIKQLCIEANIELPRDVRERLSLCAREEPWQPARETLELLGENAALAARERLPICQDTGMACVFLEVGQDAHITGDLYEAVHEGVRQGYREGYLRSSIVGDPLRRRNTGDNTPAMITCDVVPGDRLAVTVVPKGIGSENMSRLAMLKPSDGAEGVKAFVLETVELAGPNPCPPIVVGVGIGGTFDKCALLAKKALLLPLDGEHADPLYRELERELLERINATGIGPQGFGGKTTALAVRVLAMPTHIGGLPCAVNISCHVTRHKSEVL